MSKKTKNPTKKDGMETLKAIGGATGGIFASKALYGAMENSNNEQDPKKKRIARNVRRGIIALAAAAGYAYAEANNMDKSLKAGLGAMVGVQLMDGFSDFMTETPTATKLAAKNDVISRAIKGGFGLACPGPSYGSLNRPMALRAPDSIPTNTWQDMAAPVASAKYALAGNGEIFQLS